MTNAMTGNHAILRATMFSLHDANKRVARNAIERDQASNSVILPEGRCLEAVRGFFASISLSMSLFRAMARPRAPIAARMIQSRSRLERLTSKISSPSCFLARMKPIRTNGSENSVCSIFTKSSMSFHFTSTRLL